MMPVLPVVRVANVEEAIALAVQLEGGCHHTAAMHFAQHRQHEPDGERHRHQHLRQNGPCIAGLGLGGEGWTTMTITTPTGEGVTSARTFVRLRRCVLGGCVSNRIRDEHGARRTTLAFAETTKSRCPV